MATLRFVLLLALLVLAPAAWADSRIAVVIGNAHYVNAPALQNPGNDATDVAAALSQLGFKVTLRIDATKRQLDQTLEQFSRDAKAANAALFFYAGHGMQYQGRNYLVPVDAELLDEMSLRYETTAVDEVKEALKWTKGVKIVILDSCRDNPLAERLSRSLLSSTRDLPRVQGFARDEGAKGMIIVYSAQPDEVAHDGTGRNSPFSTALLKELKEPGLEVGALFRRVESDVYSATEGAQSPELSISMAPEYYLNQSETDQTVWSRIRGGADAAALKEFIARYPKSFYAPDALARLDLIESQTAAEKASDSVRAAQAEAERLKSRQQEIDAAAAAAKAHEGELARQLADAETEKAQLHEQLVAAAQERAKDSEEARRKAAKESEDHAQRLAAIRAEAERLQASEVEKQELANKALADERARAEAEKQAALEAQRRAEEAAELKARADAEKVKAITQQEAMLTAEAAKARVEAERQAQQAAEARQAAEGAGQQVAAVSPAAPPRPDAVAPPNVLAQIRDQLRRLGCFSGGDLGWDLPALKLGMAKYVRYASLGAATPSPDPSLLDDMKKRGAGLCLPECSVHETVVGGRCVAKGCPAGEKLTRAGCVRPPPPTRAAVVVHPHRTNKQSDDDTDEPAPAKAAPRASGGHCFNFNGAQYCE